MDREEVQGEQGNSNGVHVPSSSHNDKMKEGAIDVTAANTALPGLKVDEKLSSDPLSAALASPPIFPHTSASPTAKPVPLIDRLRDQMKSVTVAPLAWAHGFYSVDEFVAWLKVHSSGEGAHTVIRVQKAAVSRIADSFFSATAFGGEEDFYLIFLPALFWNVDTTLARGFTLVVCLGLLYGNVVKDACEVPRPPTSLGVRVLKKSLEKDSTACKDFGFPSTHAMNAVSNSLFVLAYYCFPGRGWGSSPIGRLVGVALATAWIVSLSFGRLYLGLHSPYDVRAGLGIGLILAAFASQVMCPTIDQNLRTGATLAADLALSASAAASTPGQQALFSAIGNFYSMTRAVKQFVGLSLAAGAVLAAHPRPRSIPTPTFEQSAMLAGLATGCIQGSAWWLGQHFVGPNLSATAPLAMGWGKVLVRNVVAFGALLVLRVITKKVVAVIVGKFFKTFLPFLPRTVPTKSSTSSNVNTPPASMSAFGATCKFLVYHIIACAITWGIPLVLYALGLHPGGTLERAA